MTITNAEACANWRERHPDRHKARNDRQRARPGYKDYDNDRHKNSRRDLTQWPKIVLPAIRARAARRGIEFSITVADIPVPEFCPVLGIPIFVGERTRSNNSPSVDRFKNSLGYIPGNVRVISNRANLLKSDATPDELRRVIAYMEEAQ